MKILLVDDDTTILELLAIILENIFNPDIVDRATRPDHAINLLQEKSYDLIICDYEMPPHGKGDAVFEYVITNDLKSKFVLFSSEEKENLLMLGHEKFQAPQFHYLSKPAKPKAFKEFIKGIIDQPTIKSTAAFFPIRIHNFLRFSGTQCPIFVKLSNNKYVKILNAGDTYDIDFIDKYIKKNVGHLFIERKDYDEFLVNFGSTKFLFSDNLSSKDFIKEAQKTHRYLATLMSGVGISEYVLDMAEQVSSKVLEQASGEKSLKDLLSHLINSKDYTYDHTYLITCICSHLCKELGLSHAVLERLSFASLVHDIGITNAETCYIHDIEPKRIKELDDKEIKAIQNHHNILKNFKNLPDITDDIQMIMSHHHLFEKDYPFNSNFQMDRLNQAVSVFLVAHCFSNQLYAHKFDPNMIRDSLTVVKFHFEGANFAKIIRALEIIYIKNKS